MVCDRRHESATPRSHSVQCSLATGDARDSRQHRTFGGATILLLSEKVRGFLTPSRTAAPSHSLLPIP
jgi:hypothetical protein